MMTCTCNPARTFTWVDEDCPTHGREAQEARQEAGNEPEPEDADRCQLAVDAATTDVGECSMTSPGAITDRFREPEGREHLVYVDEYGRPDECTEDCPGCHWEGNVDCEALASGCDLCDPDGVAVAS